MEVNIYRYISLNLSLNEKKITTKIQSKDNVRKESAHKYKLVLKLFIIMSYLNIQFYFTLPIYKN